MKPNKLPSTSLEAYKNSDELRLKHHQQILEALSVLKLAIGEEIAEYLKLDKHQIMRRMSELERDQLIYKPGSKKNTSTGRQAFQYVLTGYAFPMLVISLLNINSVFIICF